jgi:hypothetical protein
MWCRFEGDFYHVVGGSHRFTVPCEVLVCSLPSAYPYTAGRNPMSNEHLKTLSDVFHDHQISAKTQWIIVSALLTFNFVAWTYLLA